MSKEWYGVGLVIFWDMTVLDISSPSGLEFKPEKGGKQQSGGAEDEDEDKMTSE